MVAEVPHAAVALDPLFAILNDVLAEAFPCEAFAPYRVYVNRILPTDTTFPHRDSEPQSGDVTVLYYVNEQWMREWGGETIFFDDEGDARIAIAPRPGRIVAFRGDLEHRVGVPTRLCTTDRLTLAYKVRRTEARR